MSGQTVSMFALDEPEQTRATEVQKPAEPQVPETPEMPGAAENRDENREVDESMEDSRFEILALLPHYAGEFGWNQRALETAVEAAGGDALLTYRLFPNGIKDAAEAWCEQIDDALLLACSSEKLGSLKVRERIATLLKERFRIMQPHKAAVKNLLGYFALPWNAALGAHRLARAADSMWQAAGDASTDFNYYTKRGLLAAVYSSSLFFWLQLESETAEEELHRFIDRRIEEIMQIPHYKKSAEERISSIFPWPDLVRQAFNKE